MKGQEKVEGKDILVIDRIPVRSSTVRAIKQASLLHDFDQVVDLSLDKMDDTGLQGSFRKRLTRRLKSKPGFKQLYDRLYSKLRDNQKTQWALLLQEKIPALQEVYDEVLILSQPMIRLLPSARALFPNAPVHFFEHGLGDNLDITDEMRPADRFFALFGKEFPVPRIEPLELNFLQHKSLLQEAFPEGDQAFDGIPTAKPWTILALQPLEGFGVPNSYWDYFIERMCVHLLPETVILIKPHPNQDMQVCSYVKKVLDTKGLESVLWDNQAAKFLNLEILFAFRSPLIAAVFSPFSSSIFYLSKLFPDHQARFFFSMKSLHGFTKKTPELIIERWKELDQKIDQFFSMNAVDIS